MGRGLDWEKRSASERLVRSERLRQGEEAHRRAEHSLSPRERDLIEDMIHAKKRGAFLGRPEWCSRTRWRACWAHAFTALRSMSNLSGNSGELPHTRFEHSGARRGHPRKAPLPRQPSGSSKRFEKASHGRDRRHGPVRMYREVAPATSANDGVT